MKIDAPMRDIPLAQAGEEALRYQRLGFDGLWTFETRNDPFLTLLPAALSTQTLSIGTNIAVAFARSPFATAMLAWDLQRASNGRLILGLGTQVRAHVQRRFSAEFEHPAARVTEYIDCVRAIWRTFAHGERPSFKGRFYNFTLINEFFNPGPIEHPEIPVWLAGVNERMCRAAGEAADGFHLHPMNSPGYIRDVVKPALATGAASRGRDAADIALHAPVFVIFGDSEAERAKMEMGVRQQVAFYASTPSYRAFLAHHGCEDVGKRLSELMRNGEVGKMPALVPDSLMEAVAISGRFQELPTALHARFGTGLVDRVSLYTAVTQDAEEATWTRFTEGVHAGPSSK